MSEERRPGREQADAGEWRTCQVAPGGLEGARKSPDRPLRGRRMADVPFMRARGKQPQQADGPSFPNNKSAFH